MRHRRLLATLCLVFPVAASAFSDVPADSWFRSAVETLTERRLIDTSRPTYRPDAPATRAEFLKLLLLSRGITPRPAPALASFSDAPTTAWFTVIIEEAAAQGWVKGQGNCYGISRDCRADPTGTLTRAEAAVLTVRAFGLERLDRSAPFLDIAPDSWYAYAFQAAADACVITGINGQAKPNQPLNRAEMAVLTARLLQSESGNACTTAASQSSAPASASSNTSSSSSSSLRSDVTGVRLEVVGDPNSVQYTRRGNVPPTLLTLRLSADCNGPADLQRLTVRHFGTGSLYDITSVFAMANGQIVADTRFDNLAKAWELNFSPVVTVPACGQRDIELRGELAGVAQPNVDHGFEISNVESVGVSRGPLQNRFPLRGARFVIR